ncbi:C1q adipose specific-like protein [Daphnia magna]|uniref:C1q adipose specific-like protein n=1 Tax=Daphnia magna TaxID=35525 RepID=A0A0P5EHU9_9CRUS|nr:C1q adipose specific-like protein [Daphnia magna]
MARFSFALVLVLACWTANSSAAALSVEDKLQQLTDSYIQFKEVVGAKNAELQAQLEQQQVHHNEIKSELTSKISQLEAKIQQQERAHPSSPVYFYVQRSTPFSTLATPLPFDLAVLNVGNAMDLATGKFTAPRAGIYAFSFSGMALFPATSGVYVWLSASLFLNGNVVGSAEVDEANTVEDQWSPLFLQSTLSLQAGDQLWLEIEYDTAGVVLHDDADHYTHFNGWMLDE